ncbi:hypothetical protein LSAT2_004273, partial [Lamellibrachia satsuma]
TRDEFLIDTEKSFEQTVTKEAVSSKPQSQHGSRPHKKRMKKAILMSYSPDAGFIERKFVVETARQLKENNLAEDIWFDKDEKITDNPCWFSMRMEAVEKCKAAILILSDSYFSCPVSVYEGKALLERQHVDKNAVKIYLVLFELSKDTQIPRCYNHLLRDLVDLTKPEHLKKSLAERTSIVVGSLMLEIEKHASMHVAPPPYVPPDAEFTGEYKEKKICNWSANDLQEWVFRLGIKEFYRQSLAENMVDGFLLMSLTDQDMIHFLGIDSRAARKKIMQQILLILDKEQKLPANWHLRARLQRPKPNSVYLIYDPADVRLAQSFKHDIMKKHLQVLHHQKLGQSKEEFLRLNAGQMACAGYVLILLTEAATNSPFVFHELLFSDWLGKKIVTAMFKNTWTSLRPSLKAVLGDCLAIDFEKRTHSEGMDVLEHHIKPLRTIPGVVLEQAYLTQMAEGLKPLSVLASASGTSLNNNNNKQDPAAVFISYHWDMQARVEELRHILESNGVSCWADISRAMALSRGHSSLSSRSGQSLDSETPQSVAHRHLKVASVMLCCVTAKYLQSENCFRDLTLADSLQKPIVPVMLRFMSWPPEGAPIQVRKILARRIAIDLSNEKLFRQNTRVLLERLRR